MKKALLIRSASSFGTSLSLFLLDSFFFHSYASFSRLSLAAANAKEINYWDALTNEVLTSTSHTI